MHCFERIIPLASVVDWIPTYKLVPHATGRVGDLVHSTHATGAATTTATEIAANIYKRDEIKRQK